MERQTLIIERTENGELVVTHNGIVWNYDLSHEIGKMIVAFYHSTPDLGIWEILFRTFNLFSSDGL